MTENIHINDLPVEIFVEILKHVDGNSLGRCLKVCKQWKENIDDHLWQKMCYKEFKYSSQIAKKKSGNNCSWYCIFRNLKQWLDLKKFRQNTYQYHKFQNHDVSHLLGIDYGLLPIKDSTGIVLYDVHTLKYLSLTLPKDNCIKIANNDHVTVLQTNTGLLIQRSVESDSFVTEEYFKADSFILTNSILYFCCNRDIFKCDLRTQNLHPKFIFKCPHQIKDIQYSDCQLYIFTENGQIVDINKNNEINIKPINCPIEWVKHLRNLSAVNDRNFVYYSRNIFKIETEKYKHLYLEFPLVTALFFYIDDVIIGVKSGEIMLYRLTSQTNKMMPKFDVLAQLPEGQYAVQIDICERKTGPVIAVSTFFELFFFDINFYPHEKEVEPTLSTDNQPMYNRLLRLKSRLEDS